jgi:hypothetical protein
MNRALLSIGAALVLTAAALPTSVDAQSPQGGGRGGATAGAPSGGGGGARSAPSVGGGGSIGRAGPSGGNFAVRPGGGPQGGQAFVPRSGLQGGQAFVPRGGGPQGGGQAFVQGGGGNWHGGKGHHRPHFRGPVFGFAAYPYYYDYASPQYYVEEDDSCYEIRYIRGAYRRVWVCEE